MSLLIRYNGLFEVERRVDKLSGYGSYFVRTHAGAKPKKRQFTNRFAVSVATSCGDGGGAATFSEALSD